MIITLVYLCLALLSLSLPFVISKRYLRKIKEEDSPFLFWLRSKKFHKNISWFNFFVALILLTVVLISIEISFALNYAIDTICILTISILFLFRSKLVIKKGLPDSINETAKQKLIKYFTEIFFLKDQQDPFLNFFNENYNHAIERMEKFRMAIGGLCKWLILFFLVIFGKEILKHSEAGFGLRDYREYIDTIQTHSKNDEAAHFQKNTLIYNKSLEVTFQSPIHKIDDIGEILENAKRYEYPCISYSWGQEEYREDTLHLPGLSLIFKNNTKTIDFSRIDKKLKTGLINKLLSEGCISQVIFFKSISAANQEQENENAKNKLASIFTFKLEKEIENDALYGKLLDSIHSGDIISFDSSVFFVYNAKYHILYDTFSYANKYLVTGSVLSSKLEAKVTPLQDEKLDVGSRRDNYFISKKFTDKSKGIHSPWVEAIFLILEFTFNNCSLFFIFNCFLLLSLFDAWPSRYEDEHIAKNFEKIKNYAVFLLVGFLILFSVFLLIATFDDNQSAFNIIKTAFNAVSGLINGLILCMLIGRLDSKLLGLRNKSIAVLFIDAAIQPLFIVFGDDNFLLMIGALLIAFFMKLYFFTIIWFLIDSGRLLTYFYCFPELNRRINSVYDNQFEITILKDEHHHEYYFIVRDEGEVVFKTDYLASREEVIKMVEKLQDNTMAEISFRKEIGTCEADRRTNSIGTDWLERIIYDPSEAEDKQENTNENKLKNTHADSGHTKQRICIIYSKEFKSQKLLDEFERKAIDKLPYCKVSFE